MATPTAPIKKDLGPERGVKLNEMRVRTYGPELLQPEPITGLADQTKKSCVSLPLDGTESLNGDGSFLTMEQEVNLSLE